MANSEKAAIATGASQGIGAGLVEAFLKRGYRVVANSRNITKANPFPASANLALVDGNIGDPNTAAKIVDTAVSRFGRIDALVKTPAYISRSPSRITQSTICALSFPSTSKVFSSSRSSRSSRCWLRRPAEASSISRRRWWITRSPEQTLRFR